MRNDQSQYMPYGTVTDKAGIKRSRSPMSNQGDYYKHSAQGVYLPPKDQRSLAPDTGRAVLWYNPAKYGQPPPHQWAMTNMAPTNRYPMQTVPQAVPTRHILIGDHPQQQQQQPQPPQLVKTSAAPPPNVQKSGAAISIEKINDPMRPKIAQPQQDFTIHRRINPPGQGQPSQNPDFPNPYHVRFE